MLASLFSVSSLLHGSDESKKKGRDDKNYAIRAQPLLWSPAAVVDDPARSCF